MHRTRISAGLLMFRHHGGTLEVFLAHPGGPYGRKKQTNCWSIPKGEIEPGEDLLETAIREFKEEVGIEAAGPYHPLGSIRQKGGKTVHAWAFAGDWDARRQHVCNTFSMEWPPLSGKYETFPEIDQVGFFTIPEARLRLKETQWPFLDRLETMTQGTLGSEE